MRIGSRACGRAAVAMGASLLMFACGGGPSPTPTPAPTPAPTPPPVGTPPPTTPPPGAVTVTGSERLAWSQGGDSSALRFVAFVDGNLVRLDATTCAPGGGESECTSPLPPLSNGLHTIAVAAVSLASGQTGPRSDPLRVQKVSAQAAGLPGGATIALDAGGVVKTPDVGSARPAFGIEVVAEGLRGPLQLAPAPDGRVFVAEADGHVRILAAGAVDAAIAYDARAALSPAPVSPVGIAVHPGFVDNGFVYLSFVAEERPGETRLRVLRLREVAGTLGEAATIYEGPVTVDARVAGDAGDVASAAATAALDGPRLAFAPTGLLHALLPLGLQFDDPAMASWPHASVVRIADDGRRPDEGPLGGITTHPLALTWRPGTGALWGVFADTASIAAARPVDGGAAVQAVDDAGPVLHIVDGDPAAARGLALHGATPDTVAWAQAFMAGAGLGAVTPIRLSAPILLDPFLSGTPGELADVVSTGDGALLLGMNSADRTSAYVLRVRR